ncbi:MAG: DNA-processing protein DprA [Patescibacteria group bacterium]|nr:DNA-processing protein DprA [Patescibacteria group bacterium]
MDERFYWLGFSAFSGVGPIKFRKLFDKFKSAEKAWNANSEELKLVIGDSLTVKFENFRKTFSVDNYSKVLTCKGVTFTCLMDKEYPKLLKQIKNPPFVIYFKGDIDVFKNDKTIGVVGTRKITQYGKEVTGEFTKNLVDAGFTIISGLAFGVDAVSHQTAIENDGQTIAVLGSGVDLCFPLSNRAIYNSIVEKSGAVVSEFPIGESPSRGSFPSRNRIIAGLSLGVLVTEGAEDSGALITAEYAFENKRKVFAVPGPITSTLSKGPFKLISKGAKLVTSVEDILKEFIILSDPELVEGQKSKIKTTRLAQALAKRAIQSSKFKNLTKEERKILDILQNEDLGFDQIVRKSKINASNLGSILSMMEIKGMIKSINNNLYSIHF